MSVSSPTEQVATWLSAFGSALRDRRIGDAVALFEPDGYWRDLVSFTWNIKTMEGAEAIAAMLHSVVAGIQPDEWAMDGEARRADGAAEAWFTFETRVGLGRGHVRLRHGRCWTFLTTLTALKGHGEQAGPTRQSGVAHGARKGRRTWLEDRQDEQAELGRVRQPYCVIVGGGQGGVALSARLRRLGVPTIIIDKNLRPGDSWRSRYRTLVLHDPVWYDHLPYLPFPDDWPVFTPKDKFGDWLDAYSKIMELNYWGGAECLHAEPGAAGRAWSITVRRNDENIELRPQQLVFATGAYGPPRIPDIPGAANFAGDLVHSSGYTSGEAYAGKNCVVIGSGSSGHDIAADLWEHDARVTMVQRSPTIVVRSETLMDLGFGDLYSERALAAGMTTARADLTFASIPFALMPRFQKPVYDKIRDKDSAFYAALEAAGFLLSFGEDESGLLMQALRTASNYYIDVGASGLIASGEIGLKAGVGVRGLGERSVVTDDGSALAADLVVMATGFHSMDAIVADLVSPEVASKIGRFWGLGSGFRNDPGPWQGELRNMWKPTAQPNLWFHGGNLALSRHYSRYLALQIKARMEGIETPVYGPPSR